MSFRGTASTKNAITDIRVSLTCLLDATSHLIGVVTVQLHRVGLTWAFADNITHSLLQIV